MRRALILIFIAALAGACAKKQPPTTPKQPDNAEKAKDEAKPTEETPASAAPKPPDPCDGGE